MNNNPNKVIDSRVKICLVLNTIIKNFNKKHKMRYKETSCVLNYSKRKNAQK